jgi:rsbT co-antagonist protein RsbR
MAPDNTHPLTAVLATDEAALLQDWLSDQTSTPAFRSDRITREELLDQSRRFLSALRAALESGHDDVDGPAWQPVRDVVSELSSTRAELGFSPSETASFVFSLKEALFRRLQERFVREPQRLADSIWYTTQLLDRVGLYSTEIYQRGRDALILRQQEEMLELSTPVVTLWHGILALPLIGTLDSARTQIVMENLLQRIVETGAAIAVIDITGVPTVDTLTAQHLLKAVAAARLMGADCIISGIRPQIAQTIVHLGVDLGAVITKATLADAFRVALQRQGLAVQPISGAKPPASDAAADHEA